MIPERLRQVFRTTRFERKILLALAVVALGSMAGALLLVGSAVREAYRTGVNGGFSRELAGGVEARRALLLEMRARTRLFADRVADDAALHAALGEDDLEAAEARLRELGEGYEALARLELDEALALSFGDGERDEARDEANGEEKDQGEDEGESLREVVEHRALPSGRELSLTFRAPESLFAGLQRAGDSADFYERLLDRRDFVSGTYVAIYSALVILITLLAAGAGAALSRRVTARVHALARATRRVGAGDLTVRLPDEADDEVGELSQSFNEMVRDLHDSRARVEYLQRIGGWQEFARRLAHEIKNPLTPINLAAQEMRDSYGGEDAVFRARLEDASAIIQEEVATLRRLVSEFTDFSRLPKVKGEPADLRDFLADIRRSIPALLEDLGAKERVEVTVEPPEAEVPVSIDAMMLKRAVDNLVRNAVQAALGAGDGHGRVWVRGRIVGREVVLEVRDDGPGLLPEELDRIFDPYFTKKREGTGLGLPIVKKIVFEHGGTIVATLPEGGGASFVMRLPLSRQGE